MKHNIRLEQKEGGIGIIIVAMCDELNICTAATCLPEDERTVKAKVKKNLKDVIKYYTLTGKKIIDAVPRLQDEDDESLSDRRYDELRRVISSNKASRAGSQSPRKRKPQIMKRVPQEL